MMGKTIRPDANAVLQLDIVEHFLTLVRDLVQGCLVEEMGKLF